MPPEVLRSLSEEHAFGVVYGRLVEAKVTDSPTLIWQTRHTPCTFVESESLQKIESILVQPRLEEEYKRRRTPVDEQSQTLATQIGGCQSELTPFTGFQIRFLTGGRPDLTREICDELTITESDIASLSSADECPPLHPERSRRSVFDAMLGPGVVGVVVIGHQVLEILKGPGNPGMGFLEMKRHKYGLRHAGNLEVLAESYDAALRTHVQSLAEARIAERRRFLERLQQKVGQSSVDLGEREGRGFLTHRGRVYAYITKPSFRIKALNLEPPATYGFSACHIGLEVSYSGGRFRFKEPTRILKARKIRHGTEYGSLTSLFGRDYVHPATRSIRGQFPKLCITGNRFKYPEPEHADLESFLLTVLHILNTAHDSIESGYYTGKRDSTGAWETAVVYRPFESRSGDFSENRIAK